MRTLAFLLVLLPAFVLAQEPAASPPPAPAPKPTKDQVYKWVDKDGVTHYSSQPPSQNATPAKLPPLQTYKGGTSPNLNKYQKPETKGGSNVAPRSQIDVVTPSHDETFRSGAVPVAVVVTPQLDEGQRLIYLLDGAPASAPTTDTSYALTNVERGSHTVSVTLIDAAGEQVGSSTGVTFHMKTPTVDKASQQKPPAPPPAKPKPKPP
jgi:uncharacterized protein DUF4124